MVNLRSSLGRIINTVGRFEEPIFKSTPQHGHDEPNLVTLVKNQTRKEVRDTRVEPEGEDP